MKGFQNKEILCLIDLRAISVTPKGADSDICIDIWILVSEEYSDVRDYKTFVRFLVQSQI